MVLKGKTKQYMVCVYLVNTYDFCDPNLDNPLQTFSNVLHSFIWLPFYFSLFLETVTVLVISAL